MNTQPYLNVLKKTGINTLTQELVLPYVYKINNDA
jgi:hypothetical protein